MCYKTTTLNWKSNKRSTSQAFIRWICSATLVTRIPIQITLLITAQVRLHIWHDDAQEDKSFTGLPCNNTFIFKASVLDLHRKQMYYYKLHQCAWVYLLDEYLKFLNCCTLLASLTSQHMNNLALLCQLKPAFAGCTETPQCNKTHTDNSENVIYSNIISHI